MRGTAMVVKHDVSYWDALYANLDRSKPQPPGRYDHRTYNDYCREMDEWTAAHNRLLERERVEIES